VTKGNRLQNAIDRIRSIRVYGLTRSCAGRICIRKRRLRKVQISRRRVFPDRKIAIERAVLNLDAEASHLRLIADLPGQATAAKKTGPRMPEPWRSNGARSIAGSGSSG
jgi:hypothetical protein